MEWTFYSPLFEQLKRAKCSICCVTPNSENFSCPFGIKVSSYSILFPYLSCEKNNFTPTKKTVNLYWHSVF